MDILKRGFVLRTNKTNIPETIFYLAFAVFFIKYILDCTTLIQRPQLLDTFLTAIFIGLIFLKIILQRYTPLQFLTTVIICGVVIFSCLGARINNIYLIGFLCIIAFQGMPLEKVIKLSCVMKLITIFIHVPAYSIIYFINPAAVTLYHKGDIIRHSFFIGHANMFSFIVVWTIFELMFLYYNKIKLPHLLIGWAVNIIFYLFTNTNSGLIVMTVVTLLIFLEKTGSYKITRLLTVISKYGFPVFSALVYVIIVSYPILTGWLNTAWISLDKFMSGRLLYGAYGVDVHGVTLLGRYINFPAKSFWSGNWLDTIYFDNVYIQYMILFGIANLILISIMLFIFANKMENKEKIFIIAFIFYGIMEAYVTTVVYCFPLLIIGKYIYENVGNAKNSVRIGDRDYGYKVKRDNPGI